jgi:pimeloyl-ACP methyl ester carboxylesterase
VWEHFWESVREFSGFAYLTDARIPIAEIYGGMGRKDGSEAALLVPGNLYIQTMWIPGAGHFLPLEAPRDVAKLCADMTEFV